jgi:UDPglucose 6-dehydrogenase
VTAEPIAIESALREITLAPDPSPEPQTASQPIPRRVAVIGCGHVGLVLAAGLARLGHTVVGVDMSEALVAELCSGTVRIREPGLPELVVEGLASGRLAFTTSYPAAIPEAEIIFLAVDTPQTLAGAADLRNLRAATRSIAANPDHRQ